MSIVCLGSGRMAQGIAIACARVGHDAVMLDVKPRTPEELAAARARAFAEIAANLEALVEAGDARSVDRAGLLARIRFGTLAEASDILAAAEVVFEGVPEVLEIKRAAFAAIAPSLPPATIVASTSSSMLSTTLADMVPNPNRFLNAHWLNPAFLIPLVELSPHPGTDPAVTDRLADLLTALGKRPVRCSPAPGYIVPRLQSLIMNEAARMIEEGVATAEDIDRATRFGFGIRYASMGVAEFIDFGGNDILYYASKSLAKALDAPRFESPPIVGRFMAEGRDGIKTGLGFYDWSGVDVHAYRVAFLKRLLDQNALLDKETKTNQPNSTKK
jgi:3-hydroxybutyryl-CoA dehydrogenase